MDSLTHLALGAVIGEAIAGKKLGKKAMLVGAIAQTLPDFDFIFSLWLAPVDNLLVHRGITHSILFGLIAAIAIGLCARRWVNASLSTRAWTFFMGLEIFVHLFLDAFNSYGVGWFEPFSHERISLNAVFVADPFFSVWSGVGCFALIWLRRDSRFRLLWVRITLLASAAYLTAALYNKSFVTDCVQSSLHDQSITYDRLLTTPAPFNNWLWYYAAEVDSGYYVGYRSVFETGQRSAHFFPKRYDLFKAITDKADLQKLIRFSQGYFTIEQRQDTLIFNDLRFGQVAGWSDSKAPFSFHYYLSAPASANALVVQRGRFENWNKKTIKDLVRRIRGDL